MCSSSEQFSRTHTYIERPCTAATTCTKKSFVEALHRRTATKNRECLLGATHAFLCSFFVCSYPAMFNFREFFIFLSPQAVSSLKICSCQREVLPGLDAATSLFKCFIICYHSFYCGSFTCVYICLSLYVCTQKLRC